MFIYGGIMSVQDYNGALKLGKRRYNACVNKGKYPYLPVLEDLIDESVIDREVSLGGDQIPLRLVVGTCTAGRTTAFADNFMPILDWGTEFAAKWASLSDSQVNEGIRDDIKVYEYMNKFYVLEGNKRVSVLKYFNAVTVSAQVIRKIPKYSENPEVKIYYEFMDFHKATKINDIYFSKVGSFTTLMELVGITPGEEYDEDKKKDLCSCYINFRNAYESRGGDKFDFPVGDSFLRFMHIHGYEAVKNMTQQEMSKEVAKTWAEFELLEDNSEVELKFDPSSAPKKTILDYLLPISMGGVKKLKVGFVYESTPQDSEWCYSHDLGRQYIDDTFGERITTCVECNVTPEKDDLEAIEQLIEEDCELIFLTSSAMSMAGLKAAIAHPNVKILNCSLNISHKYIRSYYARMFEAKFLTGLIAGCMSENGKIGYVSGNPVYGACANINAFALGVKFVNPRAKVYLDWTSIKDNDVEENFKNIGVDIISDREMITPGEKKRRFGLYRANSDSQHLAMPIWHWGVFYEKLIQSILSGSWSHDEDGDTNRALNYWWGMSSGVIEVFCSDSLPNATKRMVKTFEEQLKSKSFKVFVGEIYDQQGNLRVEDNKLLEPEHIITMDWLLDNVEGRLPAYDELTDNAKLKVELQGIVKPEE